MPPVTLTADSPDHPCRKVKTHSFRVLCAFTQQLRDLPELLRDGTAVLTALAAKPILRSKGGETRSYSTPPPLAEAQRMLHIKEVHSQPLPEKLPLRMHPPVILPLQK